MRQLVNGREIVDGRLRDERVDLQRNARLNHVPGELHGAVKGPGNPANPIVDRGGRTVEAQRHRGDPQRREPLDDLGRQERRDAR